MKIVKCPKPTGYRRTNIYFEKERDADKYDYFLKKSFLLKKEEALNYKFSKRNKKRIKFSRPKKHLLTKIGKKYLLWEEIPKIPPLFKK